MQQLRLVVSVIISVILIFLNESGSFRKWTEVYGASAVEPFGAGTEMDPYRIDSLEHLMWLQQAVADPIYQNLENTYFQQTASVNLDETSPWTPIGAASDGFAGTYDGQGFVISGLRITPDGPAGSGLFSANFGTIRNLGVTGVVIQGGDNSDFCVGAIAGINKGVIERCYSTGQIESGAQAVGGLVGYQTNDTSDSGALRATLRDCYSLVDVSGTGDYVGDRMGGLIGQIESGDVYTSYCAGAVTAKAIGINTAKRLGGITSRADENSRLSDIFVAGSINHGTLGIFQGGLVGLNSGDLSYSQTVAAKPVGYLASTGSIRSILTSVDSQSFTDLSYYSGPTWSATDVWDFTGVWSIDPSINDGLPTLRPQLAATPPETEPTPTQTSEPTPMPSSTTTPEPTPDPEPVPPTDPTPAPPTDPEPNLVPETTSSSTSVNLDLEIRATTPRSDLIETLASVTTTAENPTLNASEPVWTDRPPIPATGDRSLARGRAFGWIWIAIVLGLLPAVWVFRKKQPTDDL